VGASSIALFLLPHMQVTLLYAEDAADSPGKAGVEMQVRRQMAHVRCLLLQQRARHVTTRGAGFE
jgi:hypothetical protein